MLCRFGTAKHEKAMDSAQAGRDSSMQGPTQRPPHKLAPGQPSFLRPHIQDLLAKAGLNLGNFAMKNSAEEKISSLGAKSCAPTESQEYNAVKLSSAGETSLAAGSDAKAAHVPPCHHLTASKDLPFIIYPHAVQMRSETDRALSAWQHRAATHIECCTASRAGKSTTLLAPAILVICMLGPEGPGS